MVGEIPHYASSGSLMAEYCQTYSRICQMDLISLLSESDHHYEAKSLSDTL
jgi:hypothetical protein